MFTASNIVRKSLLMMLLLALICNGTDKAKLCLEEKLFLSKNNFASHDAFYKSNVFEVNICTK